MANKELYFSIKFTDRYGRKRNLWCSAENMAHAAVRLSDHMDGETSYDVEISEISESEYAEFLYQTT